MFVQLQNHLAIHFAEPIPVFKQCVTVLDPSEFGKNGRIQGYKNYLYFYLLVVNNWNMKRFLNIAFTVKKKSQNIQE